VSHHVLERLSGLLFASALPLVLVLGAPSAGCGFFEELGADDDGGDDSSETGDTGGTMDLGEEPCGAEEDMCLSQDELASCSPETGEVTELNCAIECGSFVNFSCVLVTEGRHGCWCVEPGKKPIDGCAGLETCLAECGDFASGTCGDACFGRATYSTVRLLGALVRCAEDVCRETCLAVPTSCGQCISLARTGMIGDCVVERAVCDNDDPEEFPWP